MLAVQPRDRRVDFVKPGGEKQGVVGAFLESDEDLVGGEGDLGRGVDEILKEVAGLGVFVSVADLGGEQAIEAAGHERKLEVTVDLEGDGGGEGIHMKESDVLRDPVFDEHAVSVAFNERCGPDIRIIGDEKRGFFMSQAPHRDLTQGSGDPAQGHRVFNITRRLIVPADPAKFDPFPVPTG